MQSLRRESALEAASAAVEVLGTERANVFAVSRDTHNICDRAGKWLREHPCPDPGIGDEFLFQVETFALVAKYYPTEIQKGTDPRHLHDSAADFGLELGALIDATQAKIDRLED